MIKMLSGNKENPCIFSQPHPRAFLLQGDEVDFFQISAVCRGVCAYMHTTFLVVEIINHAPIKQIKIHSRPNPFVSTEIKGLMNTRDMWHKRAMKTNDELHWNAYRHYRQGRVVRSWVRVTQG